MILIISNSSHEPTTDAVVDWIVNSKTPFIRLNSEDIIQKKKRNEICLSNNQIIIANQIIPIDDISVVWYRRWYNYKEIPIHPSNNQERELLKQMYDEADSILNFLGFILIDKKWLNHPFSNQLHNKLNALKQAKEIGLNVPETIITNKKEVLKNFFYENDKKIITKPISDPNAFFDQEMNSYKAYTEKLTVEFIDSINNEFYISLFQSMIKAEYEIRTFYLDGDFFSTAIINNNQLDIKLSVRRDDKIRMITYNLPNVIKEKLHSLMLKLNLNSGSIDIIKTINNKYYFLEVNPVGQFSGYGSPNNYQLEKRVAKWLIKNSQKS